MPPDVFGVILAAVDCTTDTKISHRALTERSSRRETVGCLREMVIRHHTSCEAINRTREVRKAITRLGLKAEQQGLNRFPTDASTRKGNLAEIVLAEYLVASSGVALPVYRLRYNPNVNQSMKGDDVLAFDLDSDPVRILVGEAKFRKASSSAAVEEIVEGLARSYKGGIPSSLQFVADRLYAEGQPGLGERVLNCALLFASGKLRLEYAGMLLSDEGAAGRVDRATPKLLRRLVMISLGVKAPDSLVDDCYEGLE